VIITKKVHTILERWEMDVLCIVQGKMGNLEGKPILVILGVMFAKGFIRISIADITTESSKSILPQIGK